jgi:probable phosphomutase (TIGR03848 family)
MLAAMAVILLVRHAVADETGTRLYGRQPGVHLSERGRRQAEEVGERLRRLPLAGLYSSPLERCVETAAPIAAALGLEVTVEPELVETDTGAWTGKTFNQIGRTRRWRRLLMVPSSARAPQGESATEVQARSVRAIERIGERHPRAAAVVVSHGDPIRLILAHYAGLHLDLFQRLEVAPASVSVVGTGEHGPRVLLLNDTGGLADLIPRRTGRR